MTKALIQRLKGWPTDNGAGVTETFDLIEDAIEEIERLCALLKMWRDEDESHQSNCDCATCASIGPAASLPVPKCSNPKCSNYVESGEDRCTDCLDEHCPAPSAPAAELQSTAALTVGIAHWPRCDVCQQAHATKDCHFVAERQCRDASKLAVSLKDEFHRDDGSWCCGLADLGLHESDCPHGYKPGSGSLENSGQP